MRNWQNGRLWWNDPDAIVLTGELSEDEFRFHATVIFASGGMILSGDDLTTITPARLAMLKKLQPPTGKAARFADARLEIGEVDLDPRRRAYCLLQLGRPAARRSASRCRVRHACANCGPTKISARRAAQLRSRCRRIAARFSFATIQIQATTPAGGRRSCGSLLPPWSPPAASSTNPDTSVPSTPGPRTATRDDASAIRRGTSRLPCAATTSCWR